jgi:hypothetical protein
LVMQILELLRQDKSFLAELETSRIYDFLLWLNDCYFLFDSWWSMLLLEATDRSLLSESFPLREDLKMNESLFYRAVCGGRSGRISMPRLYIFCSLLFILFLYMPILIIKVYNNVHIKPCQFSHLSRWRRSAGRASRLPLCLPFVLFLLRGRTSCSPRQSVRRWNVCTRTVWPFRCRAVGWWCRAESGT